MAEANNLRLLCQSRLRAIVRPAYSKETTINIPIPTVRIYLIPINDTNPQANSKTTPTDGAYIIRSPMIVPIGITRFEVRSQKPRNNALEYPAIAYDCVLKSLIIAKIAKANNSAPAIVIQE